MHPLDSTTPSLVVGGCCNTNFPPPSYSYYILLWISRYSFSLFVLFCMKYVSLNLPQKQWLVHNLSFACGVFEYQNTMWLESQLDSRQNSRMDHGLTYDLIDLWLEKLVTSDWLATWLTCNLIDLQLNWLATELTCNWIDLQLDWLMTLLTDDLIDLWYDWLWTW